MALTCHVFCYWYTNGMNELTIKKLKSNPHYKMSDKQKEEASKINRKPMVEFGTHNDIGDTHNNHQVTRKEK